MSGSERRLTPRTRRGSGEATGALPLIVSLLVHGAAALVLTQQLESPPLRASSGEAATHERELVVRWLAMPAPEPAVAPAETPARQPPARPPESPPDAETAHATADAAADAAAEFTPSVPAVADIAFTEPLPTEASSAAVASAAVEPAAVAPAEVAPIEVASAAHAPTEVVSAADAPAESAPADLASAEPPLIEPATGEPATPIPVAASGPATAAASAVVAPVALPENPRPFYPGVARRRGHEGTVLLRVRVAADGSTESVAVLESSGHRALDAAAVSGVQGWRFTPARRGTAAIAHDLDVPITFQLSDGTG